MRLCKCLHLKGGLPGRDSVNFSQTPSRTQKPKNVFFFWFLSVLWGEIFMVFSVFAAATAAAALLRLALALSVGLLRDRIVNRAEGSETADIIAGLLHVLVVLVDAVSLDHVVAPLDEGEFPL